MKKVFLRSNAISDKLVRRDLGQNDFARLAGLSKGHLSMMLTGRRCAGPRVRQRIMEALGTEDWDEVFSLDRPEEG